MIEMISREDEALLHEVAALPITGNSVMATLARTVAAILKAVERANQNEREQWELD
jgi:hypothetical protein